MLKTILTLVGFWSLPWLALLLLREVGVALNALGVA